MASIRKVYNNIHAVKFNEVVETTIKSYNNEIIKLNAEQLQDGEGSDDRKLKHRKLKGVYSKLTEEIAESENPILPKRAGELYNFGWTGDFLGNLQLKVKNSNIRIFSTGTGSGAKADFFSGYTNLYGLNSRSREEFINSGFKRSLVLNYKREANLI